MNVIESQWWILELPDEWQAEQDEETIVVSDEDGVGEIAITTLKKQAGDIDDSELREYTADLEAEYGSGKTVQIAELEGYYFAYHEDGDALREWYLRAGELLLLITYACDISNSGMDDAAVDEILATIFLCEKEQ